ncbi:MAG: hypothetical protein OXE96_04885 [Gemmatimonadetes bacterium]|nr:hypothetical protein [Gemmatimonadota bacterium]
MNIPNVRTRRRIEDKTWRKALLASFLLHLFVFVFAGSRPLPLSPYSAAGPDAGDNRAAAGSMQALNMVAPPRPPIERPRIPVPVDIEIDPVVVETEISMDVAALLGERPELDGPPGLANGDGEGDAGTASEGLRRLLPPTPRGMIIPPANRELRGTTIEVWVFVDEAGQVVPDSTRLNPPTRDRGFNRQLIREAAQWVFRPGTRGGEPVAAWFPYTISM